MVDSTESAVLSKSACGMVAVREAKERREQDVHEFRHGTTSALGLFMPQQCQAPNREEVLLTLGLRFGASERWS